MMSHHDIVLYYYALAIMTVINISQIYSYIYIIIKKNDNENKDVENVKTNNTDNV